MVGNLAHQRLLRTKPVMFTLSGNGTAAPKQQSSDIKKVDAPDSHMQDR